MIESRYKEEAIALLKSIIKIPSFSKEEDAVSDHLIDFFKVKEIKTERFKNNLLVYPDHYRDGLPNVLLNSHIDTVKPVDSWSVDPFACISKETKIIGLGSNDAGASLVSLIASFLFFSKEKLPFNLLLAISAEEEISGKHGMEYLTKMLPKIEMAIVGEPTQMNLAYAERGLMVVDAIAKGKAGHAARKEGINAIEVAMKDIEWINGYAFEVESSLKPSMTVTMINAGSQHNVIPDSCEFVIDVRSADKYTNETIFELLKSNVKSELKARSFRLRSSYLPADHPLRKTAEQLGLHQYASPTLSDKALMNFPSIKMGPGKSERSHQADEFIYLEEIKTGVDKYIEFIEQLKSNYE